MKLNNRQSSMLILRHCHIPRLNYLARQVFPCDLEGAGVIHDEMTKTSFMGIIGFSHLDDTAWKQATLRIKFGGFGLTQIRQISGAAYLSSWCQSMNKLPGRFSSMTDLVNYLRNTESISDSIGSTLMSIFCVLPPLLKSVNNVENNQSIDDFISYPQKLQNRLCTKIASNEASDLLAHAPSDRDAARLRSLHGKGAGSWLDVIPSSDKHALKANEFSIASYLRLGLPLPFTDWVNVCDCGRDIYPQGYHLLVCKYGGGPVWAHNSILHGWSECMSDLHIPHEKEPRNLYTNSEDRPDVIFFDSETGQNLDMDVSLAHPWSQDTLKRASREDGFAARTREEKKMNKYAREILSGGTSSKCVPLVFEHFGRWGLQADIFLHRLSKQCSFTNEDPFCNDVQFKSFWRKRFSMILQRCNARVILKKLSRLSETKNDMDKLFDFEVQFQVH